MLRSILYLILLIILTACSREPSLPALASDGVILAFGVILTYGTGTSQENSYPAVLEQLSGRRVINAGIPGELTAGGLVRLPATLDEFRPQLLILCLGGNDMLRRQSMESAAKNLEQMVLISREYGVPVLLLAAPRPALLGLESAPIYYEVAERLAVPLEDEVIPEVLADKALKSDQIHPNAQGYRLIAEAVYKKLQRSGAL